ncbi:MAG: hypothetical protein CMQ40_10690 [Gammaproteobacteria bacterium]|nr:hypothetical protein [Gammaproteobacteria bacterium]
MNRQRSEGDSVNLTNPGPDATVTGAIGTVSGFATVCNRGGVPAGQKAPYSVTGMFQAQANGGVDGIAEGDDLEIADGILVKADAGDVVGKALDALAAGEAGSIWFRLPPQ